MSCIRMEMKQSNCPVKVVDELRTGLAIDIV